MGKVKRHVAVDEENHGSVLCRWFWKYNTGAVSKVFYTPESGENFKLYKSYEYIKYYLTHLINKWMMF